MKILKFNEFNGKAVNESLDKDIKTVMNVFIVPGNESEYAQLRVDGNYKGAEDKTSKLGKDLEGFLKGLSEKNLENFEGFAYDESASDPSHMRFEYKSNSPFGAYNLQDTVAPFLEEIVKANKDKSTKMSINIISVDEKGNKYIKYMQDVTKPNDLKWEDYKGDLE